MERHLKTESHKDAFQLEKGKPEGESVITISEVPSSSKFAQPRIETVTASSTREAYVRLMNTAYEIALHPTMSLNHFGAIINIQRKNGLRFISGKKSLQTYLIIKKNFFDG